MSKYQNSFFSTWASKKSVSMFVYSTHLCYCIWCDYDVIMMLWCYMCCCHTALYYTVLCDSKPKTQSEGILSWQTEATGLGYDIALAQRPGRADGCLIGWLPKLRQGHGFVFKNLQLLKLWDCSHFFTFSMFFFHYFSFRLLASIYWSPGVAWSCIDFSESCPDSLGRSQISAWFRTIAYSSNIFQHLIDIVSILPQGARARWFWILMTACLCRKCRQACVCLRDAFAGLTMNRKNSCQCVCSGSDGRQMAAFILKSSMLIARGLQDLQEKILQLVFGSARDYQ